MTKGKYFTMAKLDGQKAKIDIYGEIVSENYRWSNVDTSAVSFRNALAELGDVAELDIYINSPGGDVFEGIAIANMIKRHPAITNTYIDGLAGSIASCIAVASDNVFMPENGMLMIHNAWSLFMGNHNELRDYADQLEKINNNTVKQSYIDKNPDIDVEMLSELMDKETWLTANEAFEMGLVDEVIGQVSIAASITKEQMARFKNVPSTLKDSVEDTEEPKGFEEILKQVEERFYKRIEEIDKKIENKTKEEPGNPDKVNAMTTFFLNLN